MKRVKKSLTKTSYCVGDFNKRIKIQKRAINNFNKTIGGLNYNFKTVFTGWAGIKTLTGKIWVDGIVTNDGATHLFIMKYIKNVTSEQFIIFEGCRYDIVDTTDVDEEHEILEIRARKTGLADNKGADK